MDLPGLFRLLLTLNHCLRWNPMASDFQSMRLRNKSLATNDDTCHAELFAQSLSLSLSLSLFFLFIFLIYCSENQPAWTATAI